MKELTQSMHKPDSNMPWWVADPSPQVDTHVAPVHPQLAVPDDPILTAAPLPYAGAPQPDWVPYTPVLGDSPAQSWEHISVAPSNQPESATVVEQLQTPKEELQAPDEEFQELEKIEAVDEPQLPSNWLKRLFRIGDRKKNRQAAEGLQIGQITFQSGAGSEHQASSSLLTQDFGSVSLDSSSQEKVDASSPLASAPVHIPSQSPIIETNFCDLQMLPPDAAKAEDPEK